MVNTAGKSTMTRVHALGHTGGQAGPLDRRDLPERPEGRGRRAIDVAGAAPALTIQYPGPQCLNQPWGAS